MTASKRLVKRNCEYGGRLLLEGETVYVSGPYNFGKYVVFNSEKKRIYTGEIDEDHFTYPDLILGQTDYYEQYFDNLLYPLP